MSHDHSHNHDHYDGETPHDHNHDHSDDITPALQNLLYQQIDFSAVTCLNEAAPRSAATLLQKTWQQRLEDAPELRSDVDEQLLLTVPYCLPLRPLSFVLTIYLPHLS
jgi:ABC-type Zn2+ transport system substrate-binding protein/surface adhesin